MSVPPERFVTLMPLTSNLPVALTAPLPVAVSDPGPLIEPAPEIVPLATVSEPPSESVPPESESWAPGLRDIAPLTVRVPPAPRLSVPALI